MQTNSNAFKNCKFSREIYADQIINIVKNINHISSEFKSTVIALDSPWGTGKTTFVNMLANKIIDEEKENIIIVKYNSWENDMHNNALESLFYNIMINENFKDASQNKDLILSVAEVLKFTAKAVVRNKLGPEAVDVLTDFLKTADVVNAIDSFKEIRDRKEVYLNFKNLFSKTLKDKKILIIIDELDRCKPTFAIETLEYIKHLFDIENVTFLLAMDMDQLKHSVATVYGQNMDSVGYLNKFINYKLRLPQPDKIAYVDFLLESQDIFKGVKDSNEYLGVLEDIKSMLSYSQLSIRDINIIFNDFCLVYSANVHKDKFLDLFMATIYLYFILLKYLKDVEVSSNPVDNIVEFFEIYNNLKLKNCLIPLFELNKSVFELENSKGISEYRITNVYQKKAGVGFTTINNPLAKQVVAKIFMDIQNNFTDEQLNEMKLHEYVNIKINMIVQPEKSKGEVIEIQ